MSFNGLKNVTCKKDLELMQRNFVVTELVVSGNPLSIEIVQKETPLTIP